MNRWDPKEVKQDVRLDATGWRCTNVVNRGDHKEVKQNATLDARGTAPAKLESSSLGFHQDKAVSKKSQDTKNILVRLGQRRHGK